MCRCSVSNNTARDQEEDKEFYEIDQNLSTSKVRSSKWKESSRISKLISPLGPSGSSGLGPLWTWTASFAGDLFLFPLPLLLNEDKRRSPLGGASSFIMIGASKGAAMKAATGSTGVTGPADEEEEEQREEQRGGEGTRFSGPGEEMVVEDIFREKRFKTENLFLAENV